MAFEELNTLAGVAIALTFGAIIDRVSERNVRFPRFLGLILGGFAISELSRGILFLQPFINPLRELEFVEFIAEFALSLVLFKEGLELNFKTFRTNFKTVSIFASIGITVTILLFAGIISLFTSIGFLLALLIGGILIPTDPAATFSMFKGELRVKPREENILRSESALDDAVAIVLVGTILVESVSADHLALNFLVIFDFITSFFGAVVLGYVLAFTFLHINMRLNHASQKNFISFGLVTLSFTIAITITLSGIVISPAITSLTAGIVFGNPTYFNFKAFPKHHIQEFNEGVAEFGEIVAFVTLGTLMSFNQFGYSLLLGILFCIAILLSRMISITSVIRRFVDISLKESIFISWGGMRGLATGVLASIALLDLQSYFTTESNIPASVFVNSIMIALILSATVQTLTVRRVGLETDSTSKKDREAELLVERKIITSKINYYRTLYDSNKISQESYTLATIPLRDKIDEINKKLKLESQSRIQRVQDKFDRLFMLQDVISDVSQYLDEKYEGQSEENIPGYEKLEEEIEKRHVTLEELVEDLEILVQRVDNGNLMATSRRDLGKLAGIYKPKIQSLTDQHGLDKLQTIDELLQKLELSNESPESQ